MTPPFVFLDRIHVTQGIARLFAGLKALWSHGRGALLPIAVPLLAVYLMGALLFGGRYLPGTRVNGMNVSWKTPAAMTDLAKASMEDYQLVVQSPTLSLTIDGQAAQLAFDEEAFASDAAQHAPGFAWPLALLGSRDYKVTKGVSYDEAYVRDQVVTAVERANDGAAPTHNAMLSYEEDTAEFVVSKEEWGTELDERTVEADVSQALSTLRDSLELGEDAIVQPTLFANDPRMATALKQANARKDLTLELTVWGNVVKTLGAQDLRAWMTLDDTCSVTGDLATITDWAEGPLSKEYDSVGATRSYTRPDDGKYVEVSGGTYGWVVDGAALAQLICDRINEGSSEPVEIPMKCEAANFAPGGQDWGARYIDVDLSEQYVRFYDWDSSLIWASECVSGDPGMGTDTVTGVYAIYDKESPKQLIGLDGDGDGEPDYVSDVSFWMPFYGGYGLHDASWRSYFGGDAYLYDGSHGCVNLPVDAAQTLYALVDVDDVVVVHY